MTPNPNQPPQPNDPRRSKTPGDVRPLSEREVRVMQSLLEQALSPATVEGGVPPELESTVLSAVRKERACGRIESLLDEVLAPARIEGGLPATLEADVIAALREARAGAPIESLLDEALAPAAIDGGVPAGLDATVLSAVRDARLESQLDEVLAAESVQGGIPGDLHSGILAATMRYRKRSVTRGVIARIGPVWATALAASWALAVGLGLVLQFGPYSPHNIEQRSLALANLAHLASYEGPQETIDHEIHMLSNSIEHVGNSAHDWDAVGKSLDRAAIEWRIQSNPVYDDLGLDDVDL